LMSAGAGYSQTLAGEDEVYCLKRHNAELTRQVQEQEQCIKELRNQLALQHMPNYVARHARESASAVIRHEEEMRRVIARYEQQLAACDAVPESRRFKMERIRVEEAEHARTEAQEETLRCKRKLQKLKAQCVDEMRAVRERAKTVAVTTVAHEAALTSRLAFTAWRSALRRQGDGTFRHKPPWSPRSFLADNASGGLKTRPICSRIGAHPDFFLLSVVRAWADVVKDDRRVEEVKAELDAASMHSMCAIATLRSEAHALRQGRQRTTVTLVQVQCQFSMFAPFSAWKNVTCRAPRQVDTLTRCVWANKAAAVCANRCRRSFSSCILRDWSSAARHLRHRAMLQVHLDEASSRTMAAIAALRAESRWLRCCGCRWANIALEARSVVQISRVFFAWVRGTREGFAASGDGG